MARTANFDGFRIDIEIPEGATMVRVGLPKAGGSLVAHAKAKGYPILISSNALAYRDQDKSFTGWRKTLEQLEGMDVALDSAGFVAWAHYGDFSWGVDNYVELASRFPFTWWAQMDACCEAEIAGNREAVRMRQAETIRLLRECKKAAKRRGIKPPMKVLQGSVPADYVWHAEQVIEGDEEIIGIGSMCRRPLHGPSGLLAVVAALDACLPEGVRLHLFGIKTAGLRALAHHPRIASVDSMAWSIAARRAAHKEGASNTIARKVEAMDDWTERQLASVLGSSPAKLEATPLEEREGFSKLTEEWAELVEGGEIDLQSALIHMDRERYALGL